MKQVGDKVTTRYKGKVVDEYIVRAVVKLSEPTKIWEPIIGEGIFNPTIILLERVRDGHRELWFPYWKASPATRGKERYGQFAPKYREDLFLILLKKAIVQGLFSKNFLKELAHELDKALSK